MSLKILDCTLRDGGYYNNWNFDLAIVQRYLKSMALCNIDIVEIGFKFLSKDKSIGPFGRCDDKFLDTLDIPEKFKIACMLNFKDFQELNEPDLKSKITDIFKPRELSQICLVRIAVDFEDALKTKKLAYELKNLGYEVALNLMKSNNKKDSDYESFGEKINDWSLLKYLYFADSFGNMDSSETLRVYEGLKKHFKGEIGFHSHNNKGYALANSLSVIEKGLNLCDSTIKGMGRGAGNVSTESLLLELIDKNIKDTNLSYLQDTLKDFENLQEIHKWGPNLYYQFAANKNIHPTFVQTLLLDPRYDNNQIFEYLVNLSEVESSSFSIEELKKSIFGKNENYLGSWNPKDWLKDREVLLIGGGSSVKNYKDKILNYSKSSKVDIFFLNINNFINQNIGKATIVGHPIRAMIDSYNYKDLSHPIIIPFNSLGKEIKQNLKGVEILDYGLKLEENKYEIGNYAAVMHWPLSAAYAFAIFKQAKASKIILAGFDGYEEDDLRQQEMEEVFKKFKLIDKSLEISTITPSKYDLNFIE